jgi:hypothetical protein
MHKIKEAGVIAFPLRSLLLKLGRLVGNQRFRHNADPKRALVFPPDK